MSQDRTAARFLWRPQLLTRLSLSSGGREPGLPTLP